MFLPSKFALIGLSIIEVGKEHVCIAIRILYTYNSVRTSRPPVDMIFLGKSILS